MFKSADHPSPMPRFVYAVSGLAKSAVNDQSGPKTFGCITEKALVAFIVPSCVRGAPETKATPYLRSISQINLR